MNVLVQEVEVKNLQEFLNLLDKKGPLTKAEADGLLKYSKSPSFIIRRPLLDFSQMEAIKENIEKRIVNGDEGEKTKDVLRDLHKHLSELHVKALFEQYKNSTTNQESLSEVFSKGTQIFVPLVLIKGGEEIKWIKYPAHFEILGGGDSAKKYGTIFFKHLDGEELSDADMNFLKDNADTIANEAAKELPFNNDNDRNAFIENLIKMLESGDRKKVKDALDQIKNTNLGVKGLQDSEYIRLTGNAIIYGRGEVSLFFPIKDWTPFKKNPVAFGIFLDFVGSIAGYSAERKTRGQPAAERYTALGATLAAAVGSEVKVIHEGKEVGRLRLGVSGDYLYIQDIQKVIEPKLFAEAVTNIPVLQFSKAAIEVYGILRYESGLKSGQAAMESGGLALVLPEGARAFVGGGAEQLIESKENRWFYEGGFSFNMGFIGLDRVGLTLSVRNPLGKDRTFMIGFSGTF